MLGNRIAFIHGRVREEMIQISEEYLVSSTDELIDKDISSNGKWVY